MRRLLLKVLVIAVFLNTVVGLPLHAAVHLAAGGAAEGQAFSTSASGPSESGRAASGAADEHGDRAADAPCAWCLAQAEATGAPPAWPGLGRPGDWREPSAAPQTAVPVVFSAGLWSSAPRGPPSA
jgi:hypothetical protein